jgi:hypothetical protein
MKNQTSNYLFVVLILTLTLLLGSSPSAVAHVHRGGWHAGGNAWHGGGGGWHGGGNARYGEGGGWHSGGWHRRNKTIIYVPGYYYPYSYPNNSINSCPLIPGYYSGNNWIPPTRRC